MEPSILDDPLITEDEEFENIRAKFKTWNDSELLTVLCCVGFVCACNASTMYIQAYVHTQYMNGHIRAGIYPVGGLYHPLKVLPGDTPFAGFFSSPQSIEMHDTFPVNCKF